VTDAAAVAAVAGRVGCDAAKLRRELARALDPSSDASGSAPPPSIV
jgi:hypothetical protein